jgi:hypothetical protein
MYYVVELGWGKRTNGFYKSHCYAGVKDAFDGTYRIFGIEYVKRPGAQWYLKAGSLWQTKNPDGKIKGVLKKNRRVALDHRSIDRVVKAIVISVHPTNPPERITSPLAR